MSISLASLPWAAWALGGSLVALVGAAGLLGWLRWQLTPAREAALFNAHASDPAPRTVRVPTVNGKTLYALWLPPPGPLPAPAAVLMHGWGGNASHLWRAACTLHAQGFAVLVPEARNHGGSDRDSHSSLPRFAQDLDAALDWARQQPRTDPAALFALGHSVGAAAALLCAARRTDLRGVVSVAAFAHPEDVMRRWLRSHHIPYWPLGWAINRWVEWVIGHRFKDIAPLRHVAHARCPVLLVHGLQDDVVPPSCAIRLLAAAPTGRAQLMTVAGTHEHFADEALLMLRIALHLRALPPV